MNQRQRKLNLSRSPLDLFKLPTKEPLEPFSSHTRKAKVSIEASLKFLNWTSEQNAEGSLLFNQTAFPDLQALGQRILHSSMTEKDVVLFCGSAGYITQVAARRIAGAQTNHRIPQHGRLASAPVINAPDSIQGESSSTTQAIPTELGLDVASTCPTQTTESYEWTGNCSGATTPTHANPWHTANIDDPESLDTFIENGGMHDSYLIPSVPDLPESF
ncbi:hypothetical protein BKA64DRAFT_711388 [Cadophora sp. MPI-SDFR-AT-0126]|nr:hypothetical protein BKA64DRAFT_711388 [Leotiomycetes sp. MPI-SDFR-AT-0126]